MQLVQLECYNCKKTFNKNKSEYNRILKLNRKCFCSFACSTESKRLSKTCKCCYCNKEILKKVSQIKKVKNTFCSTSCSAKYNNTHKTIGSRISKLEIYIKNKLSELYPSLHILYNNKTVINSELDIYIPSLKLAFELNGIFHYEPIFGNNKLKQIQNNDSVKFQSCINKQISLCIIDTSKQKYFKESSSKQYLDIIVNIINSVL